VEKDVFEQLIGESLMKQTTGVDPYTTSGTLEYAAQQVQNRVNKALSSGGN